VRVLEYGADHQEDANCLENNSPKLKFFLKFQKYMINSSRNPVYLTILGISIGIVSVTVLEYCGKINIFTLSDPPYSVSNIIGGLGSIASVFLSAGLVYLYNKQHGVLTEQKKLSEY